MTIGERLERGEVAHGRSTPGTPARAAPRPRRRGPSRARRWRCGCARCSRPSAPPSRGPGRSRASPCPSLVRLMRTVGRGDQDERRRRARTPAATTPTPGRSPAARPGTASTIDLATPPQSEQLGVLHRDPGADHHQHRGVDVGAAQRPQQHDLDQRAERDAERRSRATSATKKIEAEQHRPASTSCRRRTRRARRGRNSPRA